jgi:hypothetical protein
MPVQRTHGFNERDRLQAVYGTAEWAPVTKTEQPITEPLEPLLPLHFVIQDQLITSCKMV